MAILAKTSPMGFNTWNTFGPDISEQMVLEITDVIAEQGYRDAGYKYVVIDDCWSERQRDPVTDKIIPEDLLAIAEIGLAGECRAVSNLESRVKEAERLGFKRVIVPYRNIEKRPIDTKMSLIPVKSVYEMLSYLSNNGKSQE